MSPDTRFQRELFRNGYMACTKDQPPQWQIPEYLEGYAQAEQDGIRGCYADSLSTGSWEAERAELRAFGRMARSERFRHWRKQPREEFSSPKVITLVIVVLLVASSSCSRLGPRPSAGPPSG